MHLSAPNAGQQAGVRREDRYIMGLLNRLSLQT